MTQSMGKRLGLFKDIFGLVWFSFLKWFKLNRIKKIELNKVFFNGFVLFSEKVVMIWFRTIKLNHFNSLVQFECQKIQFDSGIMNF
jgi:hypothetical protein